MTTKDIDNEESSVASLLAKRNELDVKIRKDHTRDVTIFFCDIKGYTSYTEKHGDLASRALCKQMTDIAFPALEEFDGKLVKTIGDAIMAYFEDPAQAVRFSIALLQRLKVDNQNRPGVNNVTIRVGMHHGEVIVDGGDLYGDSVNVAARVEPRAKSNGILISPSLYNEVKDINDFTCLPAKQITMKGKVEPIQLFQVVWDGDRVDDYSDDEPDSSEADAVIAGESSKVKHGWSLTNKLAVTFAIIITLIVLKSITQKQTISEPESRGNKVSMSVVDHYKDGYTALRKGDLTKASSLFNKIDKNGPLYSEAKAAMSYWNDDFDSSSSLIVEALAQGGDRIFPHVLDGNVKLRNSFLDEALVAYQKGSAQEKGFSWQKAQAHNGLARVYTAKGEEQKALTHYQKAAALESNDSEILTNQGVLLEKLGRTEEALEVFQKAVKINPGDDLAKKRLHLSLQQEKNKMDVAKQERINELVDELSSKFQDNDTPLKDNQEYKDKYTLPVSVWLVGFDEKGNIPKREGENDVLADLLTQSLMSTGTVEFVERALLDSLLAELKLGSSELADKSTSLRLGRLLSARFLINGSIYRKAGEAMVIVKLIETETSRIKATTSVMVPKGKTLFSTAENIGDKISKKIESLY